MSDEAHAVWNQRYATSEIELKRDQPKPFTLGEQLGKGGLGVVHKIILDGVVLALKQTWVKKVTADHLNEIKILRRVSEYRHRHIVELIGAYVQPQHKQTEIGILMWPAAYTDLKAALHDYEVFAQYVQSVNWLPLPTSASDVRMATESLLFLVPEVSTAEELFRNPGFFLRRGSLQIQQTIGCIAEAVSYLHQQGIRHKDLKPSQILLSASGLWLTDFGWSRDMSELDQSTTSDGQNITAKYHAPERANKRPCGWAEDIFALGCIFVEVVYAAHTPYTSQRTPSPWSKPGWKFQENLADIHDWMRPLRGDDLSLRANGQSAPFDMDVRHAYSAFVDLVTQMLALEASDRPSLSCITTTLAGLSPLRFVNNAPCNMFIKSCCYSNDSISPADGGVTDPLATKSRTANLTVPVKTTDRNRKRIPIPAHLTFGNAMANRSMPNIHNSLQRSPSLAGNNKSRERIRPVGPGRSSTEPGARDHASLVFTPSIPHPPDNWSLSMAGTRGDSLQDHLEQTPAPHFTKVRRPLPRPKTTAQYPKERHPVFESTAARNLALVDYPFRHGRSKPDGDLVALGRDELQYSGGLPYEALGYPQNMPMSPTDACVYSGNNSTLPEDPNFCEGPRCFCNANIEERAGTRTKSRLRRSHSFISPSIGGTNDGLGLSFDGYMYDSKLLEHPPQLVWQTTREPQDMSSKMDRMERDEQRHLERSAKELAERHRQQQADPQLRTQHPIQSPNPVETSTNERAAIELSLAENRHLYYNPRTHRRPYNYHTNNTNTMMQPSHSTIHPPKFSPPSPPTIPSSPPRRRKQNTTIIQQRPANKGISISFDPTTANLSFDPESSSFTLQSHAKNNRSSSYTQQPQSKSVGDRLVPLYRRHRAEKEKPDSEAVAAWQDEWEEV
ncbi:kinase-like protein [Plenodomus tracheiphilus IPT5]|uniref:non-specific serine/threonine protein kinase n=1 Tax=Plenodomus tracheiphilus IPT5 TaxID=1408161 RepID=A0A6A7B8U6_9PLEO|nr:kinase-like protein [Plenodomus tracheiphilus IPT5]